MPSDIFGGELTCASIWLLFMQRKMAAFRYAAIGRAHLPARIPANRRSTANDTKTEIHFVPNVIPFVQLIVIRSWTWVTPGADQAVFSAIARSL